MHWKRLIFDPSSAPAAPHCSSKRLRPGYRAAARGGSSHGPERFRWMAASSCCGMLGSGKVNKTGNRKTDKCAHTKGFWNHSRNLLLLLFQMHVAELLVSHGASLNAKTFLEETPIGKFTPQHSLSIHLLGGVGGLRKQSYLSMVSFPACSINARFTSRARLF